MDGYCSGTVKLHTLVTMCYLMTCSTSRSFYAYRSVIFGSSSRSSESGHRLAHGGCAGLLEPAVVDRAQEVPSELTRLIKNLEGNSGIKVAVVEDATHYCSSN